MQLLLIISQTLFSEMNPMQVYVVYGSFLYDGEDEGSIKIYRDEVKAEKYAKDLEEQLNETGLNENVHQYDYVVFINTIM